ncbi:MAG: SBBP repeat-containing protein, partial [Blastocatellia bacterium]|nr:SBBP repeat-containing protein [Blastocatellia bacterium]
TPHKRSSLEKFSFCPARSINQSRSFRDKVLAKTPRGQRYTQLYYKFSTEAVGLMMLSPSLILRSRDIFERYKPVIGAMVKGEPVTLTQGDIEEIDGFLNAFASKGSSELRETLKGLCEDLRDQQVHREFNITVTDGPKRELPAQGTVQSIKQTGMIIAPLGLLLFCFYRVIPRRKEAKTALKRFICVAVALVIVSSQWPTASGRSNESGRRSVTSDRLKNNSGGLPFTFEPNQGQIDPQVKFISRGQGYTMFLTPTEAVMKLKSEKSGVGSQNQTPSQLTSDRRPPTTDVLRIRMVGANPYPKITGIDKLPERVNYFIGRNPAKWRADVPAYTRVKYESIYRGIDMVYYGKDGELEYDFNVAPGADPAQIRLGFCGAEGIEIAPDGDLVLRVAGGEVRQRRPVAYQELKGERREVTCRYTMRNQVIGLDVGSYDRSKPLVIDPVLIYSTYFGGSGNEEGTSIAVDSAGNLYVTGFTDSVNFPLANASQPNLGGGQQDAFVVKLDPSGTRAIYSTYIGGNGQDNGTRIVVDSAGNAYITGFTDSTDFPVRNALQPTKKGDFNSFVVKLRPSGSMLNSTLFGGSASDYGSSIAVDPAGNIYVAGIATSPDLPMTNAFQSTHGGLVDIFAAKIAPSGDNLIYSTYLGGIGIEGASSIAVDSAGNLYLTGLTSSSNFRTVNALQASHGGGAFDAFVVKLNPSGTGIIYSTYLGGRGEDRAFRIAVDSAGGAYVTGDTDSTDFPVANPVQQSIGGSADAFVTKISPSGAALTYSTLFGGSGIDGGTAIAVDSSGNAYVTGFTASTNLPLVAPLQQSFGGGGYDSFIAKLNPNGSALDYSTYLGGSGIDSGFDIATDTRGSAYVMGVTGSTDLPTANPFQQSYGGGVADLFITKIGSGPVITDVTIKKGKHLIVSGSEFERGAVILLNGEEQKTKFKSATSLKGKKVALKIAPGAMVRLQVRNPDGTLSSEIVFTRPA